MTMSAFDFNSNNTSAPFLAPAEADDNKQQHQTCAVKRDRDMSNSRDRLPTTVGLRRKKPATFAQQRRPAAAGRSSSSVASTSSNGSFSKRVAPGEIPYVTPNGGRTRYYADRFYLDAPTSLLEYQVSKDNDFNNALSEQLYCNKCGEKKEGPPPRIRYDHNRNRLPTPPSDEHRLPLFDKAEFVNSLDLAAVIIGTYTLGDLDYLSETFPMLFPSKTTTLQHNHVPTLVLHGQKGFYLEKQEKDTIMEAVKSSIHDEKQQQEIKDEMVLPIRGGGSSQSSISSPVINKRPLECRNNNSDNGGDATRNADEDDDAKGQEVLAAEGKEKKQPSIMYGRTKLRLLNTPPKRRKRRSRKRVKLDEEEDDDDDEKMVAESCIADKVHSDDGNNMANQDSQCQQEEEMSTAPSINNTTAPKESIPCMSASASVPPPPPSMHSAPPPEPPQVATKGNTDPLYSDYVDSSQSQDNLMRPGDEEELVKRRWDKIQPTPLFRGEVFFTRVFPGWIKGQEKFKAETKSSAMPEETLSASGTTTVENEGGSAEYSDDEELAYEAAFDDIIGERKRSKNPDLKTELGVHHPKFMLLFEKSGSIVVIVSTSNLTPPTALDGSWVQRFEARHESQYNEYNRNSDVDWGMPTDFGSILTDFLSKQSEAAADGSMLPDIFLRRYVKGLSLDGLKCRYKFEDAQVHLVSTVPGHHQGSIPRKGLNPTLSTYRPKITYGPQRVSFILSRLLDAYHMQLANYSKKSRRLVGPMWIPKRLWPAMERLVFQPTSLGGNWTRESLEEVVEKYLQKDKEEGTDEDLLENIDIIWPSEDFFALMKEKRSAVWETNKHTTAASIIRRRMQAEKKKPIRERNHVFLSSDAFARLDRTVISRMALFGTSHPLQMPFTSSNLHIKSIYRVFDLQNNQYSKKSSECTEEKELFSWFMLTSACLSKGAQGKATLRRGPEEHDEMSYSNFELGVLFVSRLQEYDSDRLYVYDPSLKGCQCGSKDKNHKARLRSSTPSNPLFLDSVRKVHLPVPFKTRAKSYQDDEDYDFFSSTPYFHEVTDGTKGNMRLTPLGQKLANEQNK